MEVTVGAASAAVASNVARSVDLLEQLRALVVATPDITNTEFARYWDEAAIEERFPGFLGFVRVDRVSASEADAFLEAAAAHPLNALPPSPALSVFPPLLPVASALTP